jgi:hypothetical protein
MRVEAQNEVSLAQYKAFLENEFRQAMEGI